MAKQTGRGDPLTSIGFRRICTSCKRTVTWEDITVDPVTGANLIDGYFFHVIDQTPICEDGVVDLEVSEVA